MPVVGTHIEKIERRLAGGEIDVVFIVSNEGHPPATARVHGEEFSRLEGETLQELAERAWRLYRTQHKPDQAFSVLIVDCRPDEFVGPGPDEILMHDRRR